VAAAAAGASGPAAAAAAGAAAAAAAGARGGGAAGRPAERERHGEAARGHVIAGDPLDAIPRALGRQRRAELPQQVRGGAGGRPPAGRREDPVGVKRDAARAEGGSAGRRAGEEGRGEAPGAGVEGLLDGECAGGERAGGGAGRRGAGAGDAAHEQGRAGVGVRLRGWGGVGAGCDVALDLLGFLAGERGVESAGDGVEVAALPTLCGAWQARVDAGLGGIDGCSCFSHEVVGVSGCRIPWFRFFCTLRRFNPFFSGGVWTVHVSLSISSKYRGLDRGARKMNLPQRRPSLHFRVMFGRFVR
jgi:hypothetical protein